MKPKTGRGECRGPPHEEARKNFENRENSPAPPSRAFQRQVGVSFPPPPGNAAIFLRAYQTHRDRAGRDVVGEKFLKKATAFW